MERPVSRDTVVDSSFFDSTPSCTPGLTSHPGVHVVGFSQLIGRAATTVNHTDIRGLKPHVHDSSGAASH